MAQQLAQLSDAEKADMETPDWHYIVGWSHGKEKFEGKPDYSKGSFYANPVYEQYEGHYDENGQPRQYHNIWPTQHLPQFQDALCDLGSFINGIGCEVAGRLDTYIESRHPSYNDGTLQTALSQS